MTLMAVLLYANLASPDQRIERPLPHLYGTHDPQFRRTMDRLMGPAFLPGNRVTTLINGDEAFPAMLAAVRSARRSVNLESYIFWSGGVGTRFADALAERARAGVPTHVVMDWAGSWEKADKPGGADATGGCGDGVVPAPSMVHPRSVQQPHPPKAPDRGRPGGVHRGDRHRRSLPGHAQDEEHWRDTQFRMRDRRWRDPGRFLDNWIETGGHCWTGRPTSRCWTRSARSWRRRC